MPSWATAGSRPALPTEGPTTQSAYILAGTITDECTLKLDEPLPVAEGKVRVIVEVLPPATRPSYMEVMERIWARQRERGHVPPTRKEVDAYLKAERESRDD